MGEGFKSKNGYQYIVLSWKDEETKKRKYKWISTGFKAGTNKIKAKKMLEEARSTFVIPTNKAKNANIKNIANIDQNPSDLSKAAHDVLFSDYAKQWLVNIKSTVDITTYSGYELQLGKVCRYFEEQGIYLKDLKTQDINNFYIYAMSEWGLKASTIKKYHHYIKRVLDYAVEVDEIISKNPADKAVRPKTERTQGKAYTIEQINELFELFKDTPLGLIVMFGGFYGLRRNEILGLQFKNIDFNNDIITIEDTVNQCMVEGKYKVVLKDRPKNRASISTIPLVKEFKELLLRVKEQQDENKLICGNNYNYDYDGYVFVDRVGNILKPNFISQKFNKLVKQFDLEPITFHQLRHTAGSLLMLAAKNGMVTVKDVQGWLRHRDIQTTMDIYVHAFADSKTQSANAMLDLGIKIPLDIAVN